jgi:pSer/pThr/pTyr-binding forkhead associated (FHA) protein
MVVCLKCGHPNESFFKFCLNCGADLTAVTDTINATHEEDLHPVATHADTTDSQLADATEPSTASNSPTEMSIGPEEQQPLGQALDDHEIRKEAESDGTLQEEEVSPVRDDNEPTHGDDEPTQTDNEPAQGDEEPAQRDDESDTPCTDESTEEVASTETEKTRQDPDTDLIVSNDGPTWDEYPENIEDDMLLAPVENSTDHSNDLEPISGSDEMQHDGELEQVRFTLDASDPSILSAPFEPAAETGANTDIRPCPGCGAIVSTIHSFCGQCGYRFDPAASRRSPTGVSSRVPAPSTLVVIKEDGSDGDRLQLVEGSNVIGRGESTITFASDAFLDAQHCELRIDGRRCVLEDLNSLNGTFVRLVEPTQLNHGDMIRLGQELLRYEHLDRVDPVDAAPNDGTELLGAAPGGSVFGRLVQVMSPDLVGNAWSLEGPLVTLGRERGDILFPGDGYVSGRHATITWRDDQATLEDIGSSNGTYLQIRGPAELLDGDLVLVGQQLFRYELP